MKKDLTIGLAFLAGAALATALVLLFTTEKGEELRHKVAAWLKEKGIELKDLEFEDLLNRIVALRKGDKPAENQPESTL